MLTHFLFLKCFQIMETWLFLTSRLVFGKRWTSGYYIWKERNDRVFKGKVSSTNKIVQDIQLKSYEWIVRRSTKKIDLEWQQWLFDPGKCRVKSNMREWSSCSRSRLQVKWVSLQERKHELRFLFFGSASICIWN